jgi:hypothetical protein
LELQKAQGKLKEELVVPKLPEKELELAIEKVGAGTLPQSKRKALTKALRRLQQKFIGLFPVNDSADVKQ